MIWKKHCSKSFSDATDSSDIEEEIIKQINMLKPFDVAPRKAIPKKLFASEVEKNCEEEINWCKCGCEGKPMATFPETSAAKTQTKFHMNTWKVHEIQKQSSYFAKSYSRL